MALEQLDIFGRPTVVESGTLSETSSGWVREHWRLQEGQRVKVRAHRRLTGGVRREKVGR